MNLLILPSSLSFLSSILVGVYVFSKNPKKIQNISFAAALLSFAIIEFGNFMFFYSLDRGGGIFWIKISLVGIALIPPTWTFFSIVFARRDALELIVKWRTYLSVISFICLVFIISVLFSDLAVKSISIRMGDIIISIGKAGYYFNIVLLLSIILIIVNFENTFRQSKGIEKWQIKYAVVGIIIGFCFFIYSISETLLYSFMRVKLMIGGSFIILMVNLVLFFSIIRHRLLDVNVFISRQIIYRSISILAVGTYLLFTGTVIELTRFFGEDIKLFLRPVAIFIAMAFFGALVLSERTRRKIQIFVNKNFFANKYDYRYVWTEFTEKISYDLNLSEMLPKMLEVISNTMWVLRISIWLLDEEREQFYVVSTLNLPEKINNEINKGNSLLRYLKEKEDILDLSAIGEKEKFIYEENKYLFDLMKAKLIVPLIAKNTLIGFLTLGQEITGERFTEEDFELLRTFGNQAASIILNTKLSEKLIASQQMESLSKISSFIIHDLKNLVSTLSLIVQNSKTHFENPEFQKDVLWTISDTVGKMNNLIIKLSSSPKDLEYKFENVNIKNIIEETFEELKLEKNPKLKLTKIYGDEKKEYSIKGDLKALKKVFLNIFLNSLQSFPKGEGEIKVFLEKKEGEYSVEISDNGCGISKDFLEKYIFKPFKTTKKDGLGIGLYQCKTIINAHKGSLDVKSVEGFGTKFIINLPF
ncbi:MAG: hypothetical protein A3C43_00890 [Candidatus Schekmanbacteria bacterium RIFCSPHIGHO2_02_FULL_38_11]|uniref:histidine kinase n=1 Tax=Candidatus Schekmanbacteria bacterium RIFCSPLOWO2_12_FULL_38_15 TaxID=1817883 RepID=A0A1F7SMY9_9BACT|nr:MAG: hypothetical protein A2043_07935 [Candidatus Schekmanbacteria bacterium GWA2_38_9]OGL50028.1 MAG: hypothetical protein A3C43_00890 [Candidatus Schekmanbacteria bacterium RIFCSPHIGHO2_02_FULL_38_11]OGL51143.1 MAG: hypothetical protein A3H37_08965 [Candidatus Schekmanbacteria bacterium RIFCSPLOWO2_02_FULL_38_14]OGL55143.1 MAG: hypothetical protein A3G31_02790 [Candidatus Schekmanbacteria bacterium RIFCSPLOWO2_12_FULL_38_15]